MDATYLQSFLSDSARKTTRSEIRELLELVTQPDVISLAGGMPAPDTFPTEELAELVPSMLRRHGGAALQYGPTEGDAQLREEVRRLTEEDGVTGLTTDRVAITTASQQGLDLCGRVFLTPGDAVVCGLPSYLGALGAFSACGARLAGVPVDDHGIRTDQLEQRLVDLRKSGVRPKLLYVVPDFQNPTGVTLSARRRNELLIIAAEFDLLVIEDSPYRKLRYIGESPPSLAALDSDGRVISLFTFSKILFPGLRLGWVVAAPEIISRLVTAKQPVDLCTSPLCQVVAREFLVAGKLPAVIDRTRTLYAAKRIAMLEALDRHFGGESGVRWTRPEGGMFVWVTLPEYVDARALLAKSLERKVAFVVGSAFHCDGSGTSTLRLNFSFPSIAQLDEGVRRLAEAFEDVRSEIGPRQREPATTEQRPLVVSGEHALDRLALTLALTEMVA